MKSAKMNMCTFCISKKVHKYCYSYIGFQHYSSNKTFSIYILCVLTTTYSTKMVSILNTPILLHLVLLFIHRIWTQCVLMPTYSTKMVYFEYTYYILIKHTHDNQTTTMK